ncbi:hypothetical protein GCM10023184_06480 [Flaviaesturariibacter amylovorans]|uniref:RHS repeat-associated core domain-containing protein n=2 Tax=Flaviaesturariibacter amylovorans TaxID=1084520 RepID=A0ABP8GBN0_9BACT
MQMPGRKFAVESGYRYGFNGKEDDVETGLQDYGMRIYNPGLGRFLSVDPIAHAFPWNSPYSYAEGDPINYIDLDGLERPDEKAQAVVGGATRTFQRVTVGKTFQQGTSEFAKRSAVSGGSKVAQQAGQHWFVRGLKAISKKSVGLTIGFVLSDGELGTGQYAPELRAFHEQLKTGGKTSPEPAPSPQPQHQRELDPYEVPGKDDDGNELYYVYRTLRAIKDERGLVVGVLPYFGITKDRIVNGRYHKDRIEARNVQLLAIGTYHQAKGAEQALISLNSPGGNRPYLSTSIDNLINSNSNPVKVDYRLPLGIVLLNLQQPGWQAKFKERELPKGPNHPSKTP